MEIGKWRAHSISMDAIAGDNSTKSALILSMAIGKCREHSILLGLLIIEVNILHS